MHPERAVASALGTRDDNDGEKWPLAGPVQHVSHPELVRVLRDGHERIVSHFVAEARREDLPAPGVGRSLLVDHIPRLLGDLITELTLAPVATVASSSSPPGETRQLGRRHGEQRWKLGYDLGALVDEYGVLRHCILQAAKDFGSSLSIDDFDALARLLNVSLAAAAEEYVAFRDEESRTQKENVEFLAEAGRLLSSSLDYRSTLRRLTALVVPRLADWCAVHLTDQDPQDTPIAHVDPSKVEVLREIYRRFPPPSDRSRGFVHVIRTGEAELVSHVDPALLEAQTHDREHLALVQSLGPRSWMMVPLTVQGSTFGALTFGFGPSGRHYTEADLTLASELARRAATAIDNARLYDLSQLERSRVEVATRAKDELIAVVSHELRTPLHAILGWIRLVRAGGLTGTTREHAHEVIERNAVAQDRLVTDLLDVSRVITGRVRISPDQIDLARIVEMAVEGITPAADAKRIAIHFDVPPEDATMRGDGDRLQQVVWTCSRTRSSTRRRAARST